MNNDINLALDLNEICRLCLSKEGIMLPIFDDGSKEDDLPLSSRIVMCASIQISEGDGLPTLVCDSCVNHLDSWYTFKEQCRSSDATLRQYVTSHAKIPTRSEDATQHGNSPMLGRCAPEYSLGDSEKLKRILLGDVRNTISGSMPGACQKNGEEYSLQQHPWDCVSVELNENSEDADESDEEIEDAAMEEENETEKKVMSTAGTRTGACSTCGKTFRLGVYLQEHEASHVSEMKYFCKHCNKGFYTRAKLNVHAREHTLRHCLCNVCDKPFTKRSTLKKHLLTHGKDPSFLCFICSKTFKTGEYLKTHVMAHLGERRHVCPTCGGAFKTRKTLATHMRTHTGDRPAVCPVCSKAFRRKEAMTKHMRVHTGERPYSCPFCDRGFTGKWNLTQHIRLHTGAKPYVCSYCGKAYTHNVTLRNHIKQIHENEQFEINVNENVPLIKKKIYDS